MKTTDVQALRNSYQVLRSGRINLLLLALPFVLAIVMPTAGLAQTGSAAQNAPSPAAGASRFHLEEATIDDVHRAIKDGEITCHGLIEAYFARAKAYNGVTNELVTAGGADVPPVLGTVRAGSPMKFPTQTIKASGHISELRPVRRAPD